MISIIFSILSGVTIVLSRSVNGMLSKKMGAYQGLDKSARKAY